MPIQFFGKVDKRKQDGKIASEYPAWYMRSQIEELEESINRKERELQRGTIPPSEVMYAKAELEKEQKRLGEIRESEPKLTDAERDSISKVYKELGKEIQDTLFTKTDMMKGLADAHEEARLMVGDVISVKDKAFAEMCEACGIPLEREGKARRAISRNEASRVYKIIGRYLGENTNIERLRRDKITARGA